MIERGFLDVKTFKDVISSRGTKRLITIEPSQTVAEAVELMKKYDIEHIPVMNGNGPIGAISEGGCFRKYFIILISKIQSSKCNGAGFPARAFDTPVEKLSH